MKVPRVNRKPAILQSRVVAIGGLALFLILAAAGLGIRVHAQSAAPTAAPPAAQASAQTPPRPTAFIPPQPANGAQSATAIAASPAPAAQSASKPPVAATTRESAAKGPVTQIDGQCADLLKMATSLKSEVDKTTMDVLSLAVVREADEIEHLARKMKDEIKLSADR